jgi:hypothetical protein
MSTAELTTIDFDRWRRTCLAIGAAGLFLTLIGLFVSRDQFFRSYLWAFLFWFSIGLGCLPLLMLYHLVGGAWGFTIRRIIESGTRTLPVMALLFIPILFGIHNLYEWSDAGAVAHSELLQKKHIYLNTPFWIIRAVFYFGIWLFYVYRLNDMSAAQDRTGDPALPRRFQRLSGPGLVLYGFTLTFAVFDWAMSLEPEWYSTIYGMLWMVSQGLSALAFSIVMIAFLSDRTSISRVLVSENLHDLGNLLMAFVMLWAYLSFSQLLIIWSGNLPDEISWYLSRIQHGWQWVALCLFLFQFTAPFLLLLSRFRKKHVRSLAPIALLVLLMRVLDTFWIITPAFYKDRISVHWLDLFALIGIGGIWLGVYAGALRSMPLVALHDPYAASHKAI